MYLRTAILTLTILIGGINAHAQTSKTATKGHLEKSMVTLLFARVDFGFCDWLA